MKRASINAFKGMASDQYSPGPGEFAITKHFDVLSYPKRLQPFRGMESDAANTGIGNIITAPSDGFMYAVGVDYPTNPTKGQLYYRDPSGPNNFAAFGTPQLSGQNVTYDFLVDYMAAGNVRTLHWASNNILVASALSGTGTSAATQALTFSTIGQGLVHPKDQNLYFPYRTSSAQYIGKISPNATPFGTYNATALSLPFQYRAYCLSWYGNYLAIPQTTVAGTTQESSVVYLWGRDTSLTTVDEVIPWGNGLLKILNNLGGMLIGVSVAASTDSIAAPQDTNSVYVKIWNGAGEAVTVAELNIEHLASVSGPINVSINPRVNFIANNRLYFSVTLDPNDGIQPARAGLFSVGKNKIDGGYSIALERMATNAGTETSVIAAALAADQIAMVHTAVGTVTHNINGLATAGRFAATSVYESGANPDMPADDRQLQKQLMAVRVNHQPLPSGATVTLKYRVDSSGADSDWLSAYTQTTAGAVFFKTARALAAQFTSGRNIEFRIESTGGAVITGLAYTYEPSPDTL